MNKLFKRTGLAYVSAFALILQTFVPGLLAIPTAQAAGTIVSIPANTQGWNFLTTGDAEGNYTTNPATQIKGNGSYELKSVSGKKGYLFNPSYENTKLSDINSLSYSYYVSNRNAGTTVAPSISLVTTINGTWTTLKLEPTYTNNAPSGSWQTLNAFDSSTKWYSTKTLYTDSSHTTVAVNPGDIVANMVPWSTLVTLDPNAILGSDDGASGLRFEFGQNSGGAPWDNFDAFIDNVSINGTTYNFEANPPTAPTILTNLRFTQEHNNKIVEYKNDRYYLNSYDSSQRLTIGLKWDHTPSTKPGLHYIATATYNGNPAPSLTQDQKVTYLGNSKVGTLGDGVYTFTVKAVDDNTGLESPVVTRSITFDSTAPTTTLEVKDKSGSDIGGLVVPSKFTVSGEATDNIKLNRVYVQLVSRQDGQRYGGTTISLTSGDSTDQKWSHEYDMSALGLPDGQYAAHVSVVDMAGNTSSVGWTENFTVDSDLPTAPTITSPTAEQYFNSTPILNSWTAATDTNGIAGYQVKYVYDDHHLVGGTDTIIRDVNGLSRNHAPALNEQGGVTIQVRAIDVAGNEGEWSNPVHYYYDATAPVATISSPVSGQILGTRNANNLLTIKGTATDDNFNYFYCYVTLPGSSEVGTRVSDCNTTWNSVTNDVLGHVNLAGLPDGDYEAHLVAYDKAGNHSDLNYAVPFTLDNTAPAFTANLSSILFSATSVDPSLIGSITDALSNIDYTNYAIWKRNSDGSKGAIVRNWTTLNAADGAYDEITEEIDQQLGLIGLPEGKYILGVRGLDVLGNRGSAGDFIFTVDNTAPESANFISPTPGSFLKGAVEIKVDISDSDAGLGQQQIVMRKPDNSVAGNWSYNVQTGTGSTISGVPATFNYIGDTASGTLTITLDSSNLSDGQYNLRLFTKDTLGNGRSNIYDNFIVDNTKPSLSTSLSDTLIGSNDSNPLLTLAASDATSGIDHLQYKILNQTGWKTITGTTDTVDVSSLSDGDYTLRARAYDKAGNRRSADVDFSIDRTKPTVNAGPDQMDIQGLTATLAGASDGTSPVWSQTSGPATATIADPSNLATSITVPQSGDYIFLLTDTDAAGNASTDTVTISFADAAVGGPTGGTTPLPTSSPLALNSTTAPEPTPAPTSTPSTQNTSQTTSESQTENTEASPTPTPNNNSEEGEVAGVQTEKTDSTTKNQNWYWWLLLIIPTALLIYLLARRRNQDEK